MVGKKAPSARNKKITERDQSSALKGWSQISEFLGQPVAVAQRWGKSGMPVRKQGRFMTASPEDLSRWLGIQSGSKEAVHIAAAADTDLLADLKRGLAEIKGHKPRSD